MPPSISHLLHDVALSRQDLYSSSSFSKNALFGLIFLSGFFLVACTLIQRRFRLSNRLRRINRQHANLSMSVPAVRDPDGQFVIPPGYELVSLGNDQYVFVFSREYYGVPPDYYPQPPQRAYLGLADDHRNEQIQRRSFDPNSLRSFSLDRGDERLSCAICLEPLCSELVSAGQCLHVMHTECLKGWLVKDIQRACPVCREPYESSASKEIILAVVEEDGLEARRTAKRTEEIERERDLLASMSEIVSNGKIEEPQNVTSSGENGAASSSIDVYSEEIGSTGPENVKANTQANGEAQEGNETSSERQRKESTLSSTAPLSGTFSLE